MVQIEQVVQPSFHNSYRALIDHTHIFQVEKGGRSSGKSTVVSIWLMARLSSTDVTPVNALVVRKVGETLHDSVFEQLKEAAEILGVSGIWECKENPLSMHNIITGSRIIFRGADKPEKIKSIKTSKIPLAILWVEELAEFRTEEEIDTIVQSVIRQKLPQGLTYKVVYSYNPPKRKSHWLNKKYNTQFVPGNTYVHHSTYLDNPFLSDEALNEIELTKEQNPIKYKWNFMGETIDGGVIPFNNLQFETITDDQIKSFDNIKQGLDWGYAADPLAIVIANYDKTRRTLHVFDEFYGVKISNDSAAKWLKSKGYHTTLTTADSAEPKSVDELRNYGVKICGAVKGKGSVETGEKWLDELEAIIIDPVRCPNTAREFENASYIVDRDGNTLNRIEDKDNHTIDAMRYAVESEIGKTHKFIGHIPYISHGGMKW